ncbi:ATP-binding cassette subfamily C protein LapB [Azonexus fungiphilus]|jgi:ATP-binding cassette subfamily C protein LapB|uniref:Cyclolysin secretion/processing ATP-binding protein CyaB n=1 Tax=Azonexus fungiphilus TaxID=146940 RepID=A0A495VNG9_9RHOO|nr:type I secretion system permease/ATPase [Azonexus fungiphilus]NHC07272.1 type I secretion system permease/ATPase [Azonexus fungiphilus]RKT49875.1 ATP-binding cassette subfamily C protein LapB [Azonexus fungiphilus]
MSISVASVTTGVREDLLHHDPLLDCLVELTRIHGRPATRAALVTGLPLEGGLLTPSLFARAAARAGLSAKLVRRSLSNIDQLLLPAVLMLKGEEACVLLGWDESGDNARLLFPETGQGTVLVGRDELAARYAGVAIFARPHFRFDKRTPQVGEVKLRHWFWGALADQWPVYRDVLAAALLINVLALCLPLFSMNVYDRVVPNRALETLWVLALGIVLVVGVDFVLRTLRGYFIDLASARIDMQLSAKIMERVLGVRMEARPAAVGSFASNLRSFESVRDFITSATVTTFIDLPFALLFLLVIGIIAWPLILPVLAAMILVLVYAYVLQHKMHELSETTYRAGALRNATLIESLTALETIKTQGAESIMQAKWEKSVAFVSRVNNQMRFLSAAATNGAMEIQQLVNVAVIIVGVYLIGEGMLSMGGLIAGTMLSSRAVAPLGQMVGLLMQYHNAKVSLTSLEQVMSNPVERPADASFVHRPELRGDIEFRDVEFSYPNAQVAALRGINFSIKAGEKVVVIGRVGSGKTTLQKMLMGLYQATGGAVSIDGVDVRQLDPADLRRNIGYVAQDVTLFYGTLRDNITIGAPYADDATVLAAAEAGGLSEFVNRHPDGFDMMIGERGDSLSGGQRQGVAIARAFLMDPPILMLDEPTSAMDFSSEQQFKQRLQSIAAHKTVIIVTHRNSLLDLATRVIVIDEGKVVADGPRDQVIQALQSGRIGRKS